jgi:PAS domain S-box-containing protein
METVTAGRVSQVFLRCVEDCLEPIMLTDRQGRLTYVNPAWTMTYGYSKNEAIGQTPRLLRSSLQNDEFYKNIWATILNPEHGFWKGELTNRAKDGHLVPVL